MGFLSGLNELLDPLADDDLFHVADDSDPTDEDKRLTWANFKAWIKSYADTLYPKRTGTPPANALARWDGANAVGDSGIFAERYTLSVSASTTGTVDIPLGANQVTVASVIVAGYGSALSGNASGHFHIAGHTSSSTALTITTLVNTVAAGSMSLLWQANGTIRLSVTNSGASSKLMTIFVLRTTQ